MKTALLYAPLALTLALCRVLSAAPSVTVVSATTGQIKLVLSGPSQQVKLVEMRPYEQPDATAGWSIANANLTAANGWLSITPTSTATLAAPDRVRAEMVPYFAARVRNTGDSSVNMHVQFVFGGVTKQATITVPAGGWQIVRTTMSSFGTDWSGWRNIKIVLPFGSKIDLNWAAVTDNPTFAGTGNRGYDRMWRFGWPDKVIWEGLSQQTIEVARFNGQQDRIYNKFQLLDAVTGAPLETPRYVTDFSQAGEVADDVEDGWYTEGNGSSYTVSGGVMNISFSNPTNGQPFDPIIRNERYYVQSSKVKYLTIRYRMSVEVSGGMNFGVFAWPLDGGTYGYTSLNIPTTTTWQTIRIPLTNMGANWSGRRTIRIDPIDGEVNANRFLNSIMMVDWIALTEENTYSGGNVKPGEIVWDFAQLPHRETQFIKNTNPKGLGPVIDYDDAQALGVQTISYPLLLNGVLADPTNNKTTWTVDGVKVPINMGYVYSIDDNVQKATERGMRIFLLPVNGMPGTPSNDWPLLHPLSDVENAPNHLGAFNTGDERSLLSFRAAIEFLTHRYSDPRVTVGTSGDIVLGNEIQSHWWWHNIGNVSPDVVIEDYYRSLRISDIAMRRTNPNTNLYVCLDHFWAAKMTADTTVNMTGSYFLDGINDWCKNEGDLPWGMAAHPYPANLLEPRFWRDGAESTFDLNTAKISANNLEMWPAVLSQPQLLYNGRRRKLAFTEQGMHTPNQSDGQTIQSASVALGYYKVDRIPGLEAFNYFAQGDYLDPSGLRIGLWTHKEGSSATFDLGVKKPSWTSYQMGSTPGFKSYANFALGIAGYSSWLDAEPRRTELAFKFTTDTDLWAATHDVGNLRVEAGILRGTSLSGDPFMERPKMWLLPNLFSKIVIRMRVNGGTKGQVYYTTTAEPGYSEDKSLQFDLIPDGMWHDYVLDMGSLPKWAGKTINGIRLDPTNTNGASFDIAMISSNVPEPVPSATIAGVIGLLDYNFTNPAVVLGSVELRDESTDALVETIPVAVSNSGTISLSTQRVGNYNAVVKAPHFLSVRLPITLAIGQTSSLFVNLPNGDSNGDGQVNLFDIVELDKSFGSTNTMSDLDGDGHVNLFDYVVIDRYFGQQSQ